MIKLCNLREFHPNECLFHVLDQFLQVLAILNIGKIRGKHEVDFKLFGHYAELLRQYGKNNVVLHLFLKENCEIRLSFNRLNIFTCNGNLVSPNLVSQFDSLEDVTALLH